MTGQELLDQMEELANDFMTLATEREGAISGVCAEISQSLKAFHEDTEARLKHAGELDEERE